MENIQQMLQDLEVNNLCLKNPNNYAIGDTLKRTLHHLATVWRNRDSEQFIFER